MGDSTYTIMASLPHLVDFEKARQLPISELQLQKRIDMLSPHLRDLTRQVQRFLAWYYRASGTPPETIVREYDAVMAGCAEYPNIKRLVEETMEQRTIVAALRIKHQGMQIGHNGNHWGVGACKRHIARHWSEPGFRLEHRFAWVKEAQRCLEEEEPLALVRLLMRLIWRRSERLAAEHSFAYEAFVAYLFQWVLVEKWLSYEEKRAANRFGSLIAEVVSAYRREQPLFT